MPKTVHHRRIAAALLLPLAMLAAACGGGGGFGVFDSGRTISLDAFADVEILETTPVRVASVTPMPQSLTVARGGIAVFSATARDSDGRLLAGLEFTWRMREQLAGTVSETGVFTAGNVPGVYGEAVEVVALQVIDGREFTSVGSASIIVTTGFFDTQISSVVVFPSTASGAPGDFVPLRAAALGEFGGLVQDLDLFWRLTDADAGEIDGNGNLVLGSKPGLYTNVVEVQARRLGGAGPPVVGRASIEVLSPEQTARGARAIIGPSAVLGRSDDRVPLVLFVFDANGRPIEVSSIRWEVVNSAAGTVDGSGLFIVGEVPGQYPAAVRGTANLSGSFSGESISAVLDVVIREPSAAGPQGVIGQAQILPQVIRLTPSGAVRLSALVFDEEGVPVAAEDPVWEFNPGVISVDRRGRLTASGAPGVYPGAISTTVVGPGGVVQTISADVTILGTLARIQVTPGRATLGTGDFVQFVAQAFDEADNRLFDVRLRWALEDGAPGTITAGGLYVAEDEPGLHLGAVKVTASQRVAN